MIFARILSIIYLKGNYDIVATTWENGECHKYSHYNYTGGCRLRFLQQIRDVNSIEQLTVVSTTNLWEPNTNSKYCGSNDLNYVIGRGGEIYVLRLSYPNVYITQYDKKSSRTIMPCDCKHFLRDNLGYIYFDSVGSSLIGVSNFESGWLIQKIVDDKVIEKSEVHEYAFVVQVNEKTILLFNQYQYRLFNTKLMKIVAGGTLWDKNGLQELRYIRNAVFRGYEMVDNLDALLVEAESGTQMIWCQVAIVAVAAAVLLYIL